MKECEYCGTHHDGSYASGRFCSRKCSFGFSTKSKRKEINLSVSKALKKEPKMIEKICPNCNEQFTVYHTRRDQQCCSRKCSLEFRSKNSDYIDNLSKKRISRIIDGNVNNYGIKMKYEFNGIVIRCDSKIEYACLNYFETLGANSMERCKFFIEYDDAGKVRRYNPDFIIQIEDKTFIVEAKGYMCIKVINEKWRKYNELSILKKDALNEYCKRMGYHSFWFTPDMHRKFYRNIQYS